MRWYYPNPLYATGAQQGNASWLVSDPQEQDWKLSLFSFDSQKFPPMLSFCAEPNGEVAESIIPGITLVLRDSGVLLRRWLRFGEEPLFNIPHPSWHGPLIAREKVFLRFLKQWILQLRASPACRMTWGWGDKLEEESSCYLFKVEESSRHDKSSFILHVWDNFISVTTT